MWHTKGSRAVSACLLLIVVLVQASCGGGKSTSAAIVAPPTLASIALAPLTVSLAPGGTQQLTVTGTLTDATTSPLAASGETFTSSNTGVATVSAAGLLTVAANAAVGATATITATDTASGLTSAAADSTVVTVIAATGFVGPTANSVAAATATANNNAQCADPILDSAYYWEIGDASGTLVSGVHADGAGAKLDQNGDPITAGASLWSIASASKWIYATYVVEVRTSAAILSETPASVPYDIPYLNFTSGYTYLGNYPVNSPDCKLLNTVDDCLAGLPSTPDPTVPNAAAAGKFWYDSDHMEEHATKIMGLGGDGILKLQTDIQAALGTDLNFVYTDAIPAIGVYTSASDYALFLRRILTGHYQMSATLSADAVCTNSTVAGCNADAGQSPIATASNNAEAWHYGLGHWIEDDPVVGDGAFSSPGALGFYPWIDKTKTYYGIIARSVLNAKTNGQYEGYHSAVCGRLIRRAWMSGVEQTGAVPQ